ncbi:MAG: hypothetical protein ACE1Y4_04940, partial [Lysobacterales bacterium]
MTTQRLSRKITWVFPIAALALIIALAMMTTGRAQADINPTGPDCSLNGIDLGLTVTPPGVVEHNDVITY